jgi:hypothetical protein
MSRLETAAYNQFETPIIHNRVAETVAEDDHLRELLDVTERAFGLAEDTNHRDAIQSAAFSAADDLDDHIKAARDDAIAKACVEVINSADQWSDEGVHGYEDLQEAVDEATAWLRDHDEVVERLDLEIDTAAEAVAGDN